MQYIEKILWDSKWKESKINGKRQVTYGCLTSSNTGNDPLESTWGTCDTNSGVSYRRKIKLIS